jgi:ribosomal protein S18 acetylase RimI-like enzyme
MPIFKKGYSVQAATEAFLPAIYDLMVASDIAEYGVADTDLNDITEAWQAKGFSLASDTWLALLPDKKLAGYGAVHQLGTVAVQAEAYIHPQHVNTDIVTTFLRLIELRARQELESAPPKTKVVLVSWGNANDSTTQHIHLEQGFSLVRYFARMELEMPQAPLEPNLPAGITIRPFVFGQDDHAVYQTVEESFGDHWGHVPESFEAWSHRKFKQAKFDPSFWFVATTGSEIVGVSLGRAQPSEGSINSLGVKRDWRKRGVGMALLQYSFAKFYQQGQRFVRLSVDTESLTDATRLYEQAGMRVVRKFARYEKTLREGCDLAIRVIN